MAFINTNIKSHSIKCFRAKISKAFFEVKVTETGYFENSDNLR